MSVIAVESVNSIPPYPADAISAVLQNELLRIVRAEFHRKGQTLPTSNDEVVVLAVEIDSLIVVEVLSKLDSLLPFKVTECVVKAGGYYSIKAAVAHVVGRIESKWKKHHSGGQT